MDIDDPLSDEEPPPALPADTPVPDAAGTVRAARRRADLSQRQLAELTGICASTIGRIESRSLAPSLRTLAATGLRLVVIDEDDRRVRPMEEIPGDVRDGAGRRFPAHLDTVLDPLPGEWWADRFGLAGPPETFRRDREMRDVMRARSVWEVRVRQYQSVVPPPTLEHWLQLQGRCEYCGILPRPIPPPFTPARTKRYLRAAARYCRRVTGPADVARRTPGDAPHAPPDR